ncbi:MAG: DUF1707 domain-containing protein [Gemmatimonadetes bacterium]|nr:DUF1707 domain-containing protein [Gemmatimonadota bacterium]
MSLELERERTVQALCSHYAQDHLTTQELEVRFEAVYRAASTDALHAALRDLPALPPALAPQAAPPPMYGVAAPHSAPSEKRFLAVMSEVSRKGGWVIPSRIKAKAIMGTVRLDLREADVPPEGVDIDATAFMGEVRIILPPGLHADVDGVAFMGEFIDRTIDGDFANAPGPLVRVRGSAVMGSVRVETRLPNESALMAWKRRLLKS